jgi:TatA/E family protein of Tat protein translocase
MLNIGPQELLLILVLALLVVGPKRLPELGRSLGRGIRELRKAQDEVRKTIQINLDEEPESPPTRAAARALPDEGADDGDERAPASGTDAAAPAAAGSAAASAGESDGPGGVSEISRTLGRSLAELRRAREEIQRSFRVDIDPPQPPRRPIVRSSASPGSTVPATVEADTDTPDPAPASLPVERGEPRSDGDGDGDAERTAERPG